MAKRGRKPHYENANTIAKRHNVSACQIEIRAADIGVSHDATFGKSGKGYGVEAVRRLEADIRRNPFKKYNRKLAGVA